MKLTYYSHSCFEVDVCGKRILFDPYITGNDMAKNIKVAELRPDYILLSHGHFDHVGDTVEIAKATGATVVGGFEVTAWLEKKGVKSTHGMNPGGSWKFDFARVKFVEAVHSNSMPDGSYGGAPGGFVVESPEGTFYYSGDTALTPSMKLIGDAFKLDFGVLCIGDNFTMGVSDSIKASDLVGCSKVFGVHYDTFPPIKIDKQAAIAAYHDAGKSLKIAGVGESFEF
jgi:L-ascorbate metabolism protein UlaG (beta-lactamase superfamily)